MNAANKLLHITVLGHNISTTELNFSFKTLALLSSDEVLSDFDSTSHE